MKKRSKKKILTAAAALVLIFLISLILRRHRLYPPEHIIGEIGKSYEILGTGGIDLTVEDVWENFSTNQSFLTISYYPVHVKIRLGGIENEGN